MPVEAPDGTAAVYLLLVVVTSTSTVGLPRLSKIWRAQILVIVSGAAFDARCCDMKRHGSAALALTHALMASSTVAWILWVSRYACTSCSLWAAILAQKDGVEKSLGLRWRHKQVSAAHKLKSKKCSKRGIAGAAACSNRRPRAPLGGRRDAGWSCCRSGETEANRR